MFFHGFFLSTLSFTVILFCQSIIIRAEFHFSHRIWPAFLLLGILLLIFAIFMKWLWIAVIFCSAAVSLLFGAFQLRGRLHGCTRGRSCFSSKCFSPHKRR